MCYSRGPYLQGQHRLPGPLILPNAYSDKHFWNTCHPQGAGQKHHRTQQGRPEGPHYRRDTPTKKRVAAQGNRSFGGSLYQADVIAGRTAETGRMNACSAGRARIPGRGLSECKPCGVNSACHAQGGTCTGRARADGRAGVQPAAQLEPWPSSRKTRLRSRPRDLTLFLRVKGSCLPEGSSEAVRGREECRRTRGQ